VLKRYLLLISWLFVTLCGCIEEYKPEEEELQPGTLVVVADLNNIPGKQFIYLSRSMSLESLTKDPVTGCLVQVEREDGVSVDFQESDPGEYGCFLDEEFLTAGAAYQLMFVTREGDRYESEFEKLYPPSDIDSVYYIREDHPTSDPAVIEEGIQFYIDFEIEKDSGRFLRWQLTETYELHNPDYETTLYDVDRRFYKLYASDKWLTCWITLDIPEIFTLDLANVDGSLYRNMTLNFVSNQTKRLHQRYSLLVRQLALSEKTFWYWNELGKNVQSKGGLFDTQPALTPSNICNVEEEGEMIIGYFSISGAFEKRIFVDDVPGLDLYSDPFYCAPDITPLFLHVYPQEKLPLYLASANILGEPLSGVVKDYCVDCRLKKGSTHIKPEFW
jgi:hypothetical protein